MTATAKTTTEKTSAKASLKKATKNPAPKLTPEGKKVKATVEVVVEPPTEVEAASTETVGKAEQALVLDRAPKNESEAKALLTSIGASVDQQNQALYTLGLDWLAMRARRSDISEEEKGKLADLPRGVCARRLADGTSISYNGFGFAGFLNEGDAAVSLGLATARLDSKGKVTGYNLNRVSQAVNGARIHLKLLDAGVESGIGVFDKGTAGIVMRSNDKVIDAIVPMVAEGKSTEEVRAKVEELINANSKRRSANVKLDKIKTPDLKAKVSKLLAKVAKACARVEIEAKAGRAFWTELLKRTDLKDNDSATYDTKMNETQDAAVAVVKALGLEVA
jgi:hypothetical protein